MPVNSHHYLQALHEKSTFQRSHSLSHNLYYQMVMLREYDHENKDANASIHQKDAQCKSDAVSEGKNPGKMYHIIHPHLIFCMLLSC